MTKVTFAMLADRFAKELLSDLDPEYRPSVHCAALIGKDLARATFRLFATDSTEVTTKDFLPVDMIAEGLADVVRVLNNVGKKYEDQADREEQSA